MKYILGIFSVETIIAFVTDLLAKTVKNPSSAKALQLRSVVNRLRKATTQFLEQTGGIPVE